MSALAIVLIVLGVILVIALIFGFIGIRARDRRQEHTWQQSVAEADAALEEARAADRGWDRDAMTAVAARAIGEQRPGWSYDELLLVLVDDRPGVEEDRAQFVAVDDGREQARVVLRRAEDQWVAEDFEWLGD